MVKMRTKKGDRWDGDLLCEAVCCVVYAFNLFGEKRKLERKGVRFAVYNC